LLLKNLNYLAFQFFDYESMVMVFPETCCATDIGNNCNTEWSSLYIPYARSRYMDSMTGGGRWIIRAMHILSYINRFNVIS
jgi:hypothetical protein